MRDLRKELAYIEMLADQARENYRQKAEALGCQSPLTLAYRWIYLSLKSAADAIREELEALRAAA